MGDTAVLRRQPDDGTAIARVRWAYRCGTCGEGVSVGLPCASCPPYVGVAVVGCCDCDRTRAFASEVADHVAQRHEAARGHLTWVVLDQSMQAPGEPRRTA